MGCERLVTLVGDIEKNPCHAGLMPLLRSNVMLIMLAYLAYYRSAKPGDPIPSSPASLIGFLPAGLHRP